MRRKRYIPEQIISMLREAEVALAQGQSERLDRAGLARPVAGFGEERLQAHRFRPQERCGLCRAAEFLRLLVGLALAS